MERGTAARDGHRVLDTHPVGQLALEGIEIRTDRCDPVGIEGFEEHASFLGPDVGR